MVDVDQLGDRCQVELKLQLPRELAAEVEEVQRVDPDALSRILLYGLTRRTIYRRLASRSGETAETG